MSSCENMPSGLFGFSMYGGVEGCNIFGTVSDVIIIKSKFSAYKINFDC